MKEVGENRMRKESEKRRSNEEGRREAERMGG